MKLVQISYCVFCWACVLCVGSCCISIPFHPSFLHHPFFLLLHPSSSYVLLPPSSSFFLLPPSVLFLTSSFLPSSFFPPRTNGPPYMTRQHSQRQGGGWGRPCCSLWTQHYTTRSVIRASPSPHAPVRRCRSSRYCVYRLFIYMVYRLF